MNLPDNLQGHLAQNHVEVQGRPALDQRSPKIHPLKSGNSSEYSVIQPKSIEFKPQHGRPQGVPKQLLSYCCVNVFRIYATMPMSTQKNIVVQDVAKIILGTSLPTCTSESESKSIVWLTPKDCRVAFDHNCHF